MKNPIFSYAIAFWYGVKLIMDDRELCFTDLTCEIRYDPASLLIVSKSMKKTKYCI